MKSKNITTVIKNLVKEYTKFYHIKPYEINNGLCEEFAFDVINETDYTEIVRFKDIHTVVWYNDKFYDCLHPYGVPSIPDLLFAIDTQNKPNEVK
jgi:hypothetical protein